MKQEVDKVLRTGFRRRRFEVVAHNVPPDSELRAMGTSVSPGRRRDVVANRGPSKLDRYSCRPLPGSTVHDEIGYQKNQS
jgi:hypothetical protein